MIVANVKSHSTSVGATSDAHSSAVFTPATTPSHRQKRSHRSEPRVANTIAVAAPSWPTPINAMRPTVRNDLDPVVGASAQGGR